MLRIDSKLARALGAFGMAAFIAVAAGCGGGGSGGSTSTSSTGGSATNVFTPTGAVSSTPATLASNQMAVVVSTGLTGRAANIPMVSVTVCVPGSGTCQTINNVQLDTGSFGLRLAKAALNSTMVASLPVETLIGGQSLAECTGFADGHTWGSVRTADVTLGTETASAVPVQILGDVAQSAAGGARNACASGILNNSPSQLSANGILGVGPSKYDCASTGTANCTSTGVANNQYYGCTSTGGVLSGCTDAGVPSAQQVTNPVRLFVADNNGVVVNMPPLADGGAISASGVVTFGVGTQANNTVPSSGVTTYTLDHFGNSASAQLNGSSRNSAFFDTGSNGLFFTDNNNPITLCTSGFYCPSSTVSRSVTVQGFNGNSGSSTINIGNADQLFSDGGYAFNDVGAPQAIVNTIDLGMPFFYGRTLYMNYDTSTTVTSGTATTAFAAF